MTITRDEQAPSSSTQAEQRNPTSKLRKTFRELKSYTSKLAEFALQWQDLEDHFLSIKTQLHELEKVPSFPSLDNSAPTHLGENPKDSIFIEITEDRSCFGSENEVLEGKDSIYIEKTGARSCFEPEIGNPEGKADGVSGREGFENEFPSSEIDGGLKDSCFHAENEDLEGEFCDYEGKNENPDSAIRGSSIGLSFETTKEEQEVQEGEINGDSMKGCPFPLESGKDLVLYLNVRVKEHETLRDELSKYLKLVANPGKLVLEALSLFVPTFWGGENGKLTKETTDTRRSCVLLLEALVRVGPLMVNDKDREHGARMALDWKGKVVNGHKVDPFGVWVFFMFVALFGLVASFDEDDLLSLFEHVVQRPLAPEVFQALGFANKAHDLVLTLIGENKRLQAVPFIFKFKLIDKFPPVYHLKLHAKQAKKIYVRSTQNSSMKVIEKAIQAYKSALRSIVKLVEKYKLHAEYSPKIIRQRMQQVRKKMIEKQQAKGTALAIQTSKKVKKHASPSVGEPNQNTSMQNADQFNAPYMAISDQHIHEQRGNKRKAPLKPDEYGMYKHYQGAAAAVVGPSTSVDFASYPLSKRPSEYKEGSFFRGECARSLFRGEGARYLTSPGGEVPMRAPATSFEDNYRGFALTRYSSYTGQQSTAYSGLERFAGSSPVKQCSISSDRQDRSPQLTSYSTSLSYQRLSPGTYRFSRLDNDYHSSNYIPRTQQSGLTSRPYGSSGFSTSHHASSIDRSYEFTDRTSLGLNSIPSSSWQRNTYIRGDGIHQQLHSAAPQQCSITHSFNSRGAVPYGSRQVQSSSGFSDSSGYYNKSVSYDKGPSSYY